MNSCNHIENCSFSTAFLQSARSMLWLLRTTCEKSDPAPGGHDREKSGPNSCHMVFSQLIYAFSWDERERVKCLKEYSRLSTSSSLLFFFFSLRFSLSLFALYSYFLMFFLSFPFFSFRQCCALVSMFFTI